MTKDDLFSTPQELDRIQHILTTLLKLPLTDETISGDLMERVFAHVRDANALKTYDFVDVIDPTKRLGWQVKSTMSSTPVTWIRGKIPQRDYMISKSEESAEALKALGDAIISYCNHHIWETGFEKYNLDHIGYVRLIVFPDGKIRYFERHLCSRDTPLLFNADSYRWKWSAQKNTKVKEQLSALHGYFCNHDNSETVKHWAWHGRGENQLHFSGESEWWPNTEDSHARDFTFPSQGKLSFDDLVNLLI
jgi:hypothetical protein